LRAAGVATVVVAMGHDFTGMLAPAAIRQNCQNRRRLPRLPKLSIRTGDEFGCSALQSGFFGNFGIHGNRLNCV